MPPSKMGNEVLVPPHMFEILRSLVSKSCGKFSMSSGASAVVPVYAFLKANESQRSCRCPEAVFVAMMLQELSMMGPPHDSRHLDTRIAHSNWRLEIYYWNTGIAPVELCKLSMEDQFHRILSFSVCIDCIHPVIYYERVFEACREIITGIYRVESVKNKS